MKYLSLFVFFWCCIAQAVYAQKDEACRVWFKDKGSEPVVSGLYVDRPIYGPYLTALEALGGRIQVQSSWLNAAMVLVPAARMETVRHLPFVERLEPIIPRTNLASIASKPEQRTDEPVENQDLLRFVGLDALHAQGWRGQNIPVAVFDSGFLNADQNPAFDSVRISGRLMAVRDFVNTQPGANVYQEDNHGTLVWSVMAGVLPGQYRGAAPDARYALVRTENAASETLDEELTWAAGAEWAATNGIRLINSSLGYSTFDNPADNHDYQDLDGNTTPIAQAARIAVSKGLLVVNSAGNEGQGLWERILTPCDVDGLLCVGGTFSDSLPVPFSSKGPTGDGRIKPDVVAWASNVPLLNPQGFPQKASGTSFSTPLVAGLAACLWSAKPEASAQDVFRAIRKTAWLPACALPNNTLGWGIPNGPRALAELRNPTDRPGQTSLTGFRAWFTTGHIHLDWPDGPDVFAVDVLNLTGQQVGHYQGLQPGRRYRLALPDEWPAGVYILRLSTTSGVGYTRKLIYAAD